ncbi:MAG TPA: NAD(P)H-dependent oxidoreductase [Solirubrobacterales bacterium]|nr:NAD(P)H-dependent oxidoreductase [Solirubrobacterales bacterium]
MRIAIIIGTTRPNRKSEKVARWVHELASGRDDAEFELIDLAEAGLPLLDEPKPPGAGDYSKEHTKRWAGIVDSFDAYVFVTGEYNHGIPAALKNALDFVYAEWNDKAAGFVGYGNTGGARSIEQLRGVVAELQMASVRTTVNLNIFTDFDRANELTPDPRHEKKLGALLDELVAWGGALRELRSAAEAP